MADTTTTLTTYYNLMKKFNTLLDCPIRFSGHYGDQNVQHFIDYLDAYKKVKCIADDQALKELELLLTENAHHWWLRRRRHFSTWCEAKTALQNQYSKQRPVHVIYTDIFGQAYNEYNSDEEFINDKYELFNELPDPKPSEKHKLDMIFALLPCERQSKVDYSKISSVLELKDQLKKIQKKAKRNGDELIELQRTVELKEKLNGIIRIVVADDQQSQCNVTTPAEVHIVNDKDPVIKVRRTEDLMPQVKQEEHEQSIPCEQDEFISTESDINGSNESMDNFQIDTDIMNQINTIIDESEMQCDNNVCNSIKVSSVMPATESTPTTIAFLINGETKLHKITNNINNNVIKKKIRCSFCRRNGHTAQVCLKKSKQKNLIPEKFDESGNLKKNEAIISPKETELIVTSSNNNFKNERDENNSVAHVPDTTIMPLVSNVHSQEAASTLSSSQQHSITSTEPSISAVFTLNPSLPSVPPPFNHITTLSAVSPSISHAAALTTKLIAPINGPGPNKHLAAKLRGINGPSPKCHQCGNVGFYKSICPNCSPIYNTNQYKP